MSPAQSTGVDAEGFILTVPHVPVQREFQPLLEAVCNVLSQPDLGVDGIYLYGSVARGDALPGVSDLDLTVVLGEPPTSAVLERLERVRCHLAVRYPQVTKVDFDIGSRAGTGHRKQQQLGILAQAPLPVRMGQRSVSAVRAVSAVTGDRPGREW